MWFPPFPKLIVMRPVWVQLQTDFKLGKHFNLVKHEKHDIIIACMFIAKTLFKVLIFSFILLSFLRKSICNLQYIISESFSHENNYYFGIILEGEGESVL